MTDSDLTAYRVVAEFEAFIRRPEPLKTGMTALLFAENGPNADQVNKLGVSAYQDAFVAVEMFDGNDPMDGFFGYVRRPKPLVSGMVAQFFGENGSESDRIAVLGLSNFLDMKLNFKVRYVKDPVGKDMKQEKGPHSEAATILWRSSFFGVREVWVAIGSDVEFLEWTKKQECCINAKKFGPHQGDIVPMHVRRVGNGSGTGIKPEYSVIPGCWGHHTLMQHQKGESAVGGRQFYDRKRIEYLKRWCWEKITALFEKESMTFVAPSAVFSWAIKNGVDKFLPLNYRKFLNAGDIDNHKNKRSG